MSENKTINVAAVLGKDAGILSFDGDKLYATILDKINSMEVVEIDFTEMRYITSAFINASIGRFFLENPLATDMLSFLTLPEQELEFRIERCKQLAINERLRNAHNQAIEDVLA